MINSNEQLRPRETFQEQELSDTQGAVRLTQARVEQLFVQRKETLSSIKSAITATLHDAIESKIRYERSVLLEIMETDARVTDARIQRNKILRSEYFIQKPLDKNIL